MDDPRLYSWPELPLTIVVGAGGMGAAVAKRLGQHSRLLVTDLSQARLDAVKAELVENGCHVTTVQCDITNEDSVIALAKVIEDQGGFRSLAHVAGLSPSMADWRTIMSVNLIGATHVVNKLLPLVQPKGAAVFVSSLAGHLASPSEAVLKVLSEPLKPEFMDELVTAFGKEPTSSDSYMLSKNALNKMCQRLSPRWGERKARIVSISPGLIATPMGALEFKNQPVKFDLLAKTPLKRQGNMHEIADAIEFLLSDKASFISGTDLLVDGGIHAALVSVN